MGNDNDVVHNFDEASDDVKRLVAEHEHKVAYVAAYVKTEKKLSRWIRITITVAVASAAAWILSQ